MQRCCKWEPSESHGAFSTGHCRTPKHVSVLGKFEIRINPFKSEDKNQPKKGGTTSIKIHLQERRGGAWPHSLGWRLGHPGAAHWRSAGHQTLGWAKVQSFLKHLMPLRHGRWVLEAIANCCGKQQVLGSDSARAEGVHAEPR